MSAVRAGGPSAINGVLYQLLWALATLGNFRGLRSQLAAGELDNITLVLEPSNGGDQQAISAAGKIVTQLKARSGLTAWSLRSVIEDVLTDLFLAVDLNDLAAEFQFVTEGHRGRWSEVESFWRQLPPAPAVTDVLSQLPDTGELTFARGDRGSSTVAPPFWGNGPYSRRRLFKKIVDTIRKDRPKAVVGESYDDTCRRVWELLRRFRFVESPSHAGLRERLDQWLLARIGSSDRLAVTRSHLLLELANLACEGSATVERASFLACHGLDKTPLTDWLALSKRADDYLTGLLRRKNTQPGEDVRPKLTAELARQWTHQAPILILTGESGSGKTCHGFELLTLALRTGDVALLVDSRRDADRDLDEASKTFWVRVAGRSESAPIEGLRERLRQINAHNESRSVAILFDNVTELEEAQRLIEADWEGWKIRVLMTCPREVAAAVDGRLGTRGSVVTIPDFTLEELKAFLSEVVGVDWAHVPFDVQKTLRRPLLAHLFRDVVTPEGWQPHNEYELFECCWGNLRKRDVHPFDLDALRRLAGRLLVDGASYPWSVPDLRAADLSEEAVDRLVSAGWLRETTANSYEVFHDRLLNWTIAEYIADEIRKRPESVGPLSDSVSSLFERPQAACGRWLAYVPMDVSWLLLALNAPRPDLFNAVIAKCEAVLGWRASDILHRDLIPTLGTRAVPFLLDRLRSVAKTGPPYVVSAAIDGLVATRTQEICAQSLELITDQDPKVCRAGVRLLARVPTVQALERLWAIHADAVREPGLYLWEHEHSSAVYEDTFDALIATVRLSPGFLERAVADADQSRDPVHDLAYLVAQVGDPNLWERCKPHLLAKVAATRQRSLATCIYTFRDANEIDWLTARVQEPQDLLGPAALRALAAIAPERALSALDALPERLLPLTRDWCFGELLRRLPHQVMRHFATRLRSEPDPLQFSQVLQKREDRIDPDSFDFLLDRLSDALSTRLSSGSPEEITGACRAAIMFVNAVCRPILLDRLRARRGTALEAHFTDWLLALGPQSGNFREYDKHEGLKVLTKIGGEGFSCVVNDWLERGDWFAHTVALPLARRRSNPRTLELLVKLSQGNDDGEHPGFVSGYAAAALACHGCWRELVEYYLRVGVDHLTVVEECCPNPDPPLSDEVITIALSELSTCGHRSAGAVLVVGLSGRKDLIPLVHEAFQNAAPESGTALASLVALRWLGDKTAEIVPVIQRCLPHREHDALNALLANWSPEAQAVLRDVLRAGFDAHIAAVLTETSYRDEALAAIRRAIRGGEYRGANLQTLARRLKLQDLAEIASDATILSRMEELAYSPYGGICYMGEKPAALKMVGRIHADSAARVALERLRSREAGDAEQYVPLITEFATSGATDALLEAVRVGAKGSVVQAVGRELARLGAVQSVLGWLSDNSLGRQHAACRVAGFLQATPELTEAVTRCSDKPDNRVSRAAAAALELFERQAVVQELIEVFRKEADVTHLWVLLDAIVAAGDPGDGNTLPYWVASIRDWLTPAMGKHLGKQLEERRKKQDDELKKEVKKG